MLAMQTRSATILPLVQMLAANVVGTQTATQAAARDYQGVPRASRADD